MGDSQSSKFAVYQRKNHANAIKNNSSETQPPKSGSNPNNAGPSSQYQTLNCRSFWKAGCDDAVPFASYKSDEKLEPSEFERARVHPKFLHSNATSHTWAFGAIAELLDNAVDEICNGASFVKVDRVFNPRDKSPILVFHDDGGGMDPEGIRHCMSLGFSSKKALKTIGQYGNGFKTSTMRLGADAIVFTCSSRRGYRTQSIGLLSYTYLLKTMKNDIIVPIVDFKFMEDQAVPLIYGSQDDWDNELKVMMEWSPFATKDELMRQFDDVGSHGTKVLLYNLWFDDEGRLELGFDDVHNDIKLRDNTDGTFASRRAEILQTHISYTYRYSLRAYISILYLKKYANFRIILRGEPVKHLNLADDMKFLKVVPYRPFVGKEESVATTIGFTKEAPILGAFGLNIYHKNRLVLAFCKPLQEASVRGKCVVGFLEANFLEPAHDKQDFERSPLFHRLESKLRSLIMDYWKNHCHLIGYQSLNPEIRAKQNQANQSSPLPRPNALQGFAPSQSIDGMVARQLSTPGMPGVSPQDGAGPSPMEPSEEFFTPDEESAFIDKITKENLKLSISCKESKARQEDLKKYIAKLEEELEETKRKCAQIALEIDVRKKQKTSGNSNFT